MAHCLPFPGSLQEYPQQFVEWIVAVRPGRCPHCGRTDTYIFWARYQRWVYTRVEQLRICIQRVRCTACGATDALLPSFLHLFRRYALPLIQQAISLALEAGVWGQALIDRLAPYHQPAPSTLSEWVWSLALSAEGWLVLWLQCRLILLDPLADLDLGRPPEALLTIPNERRRKAFLHGWQALRLAERLYAATRARQPDLTFQPDTLLAFVAALRADAGFPPRLLWPDAPRAP